MMFLLDLLYSLLLYHPLTLHYPPFSGYDYFSVPVALERWGLDKVCSGTYPDLNSLLGPRQYYLVVECPDGDVNLGTPISGDKVVMEFFFYYSGPRRAVLEVSP